MCEYVYDTYKLLNFRESRIKIDDNLSVGSLIVFNSFQYFL